VLGSLSLGDGDHVLTTQHRYEAVANTLARNAEAWGAQVIEARVPFPLRDPAEIIAAFEEAWTPSTRLLVIDHITSPTALVLPVRELTQLAHSRGAQVLVDAAHAPGQLDVAIHELGVDYWTGNLHKWVCAPRGAALLWVAPPHRGRIHHPVTSLGWQQEFPAEFDWTGTDDPSPWLACTTAMDLHDSWGGARLRSSNHALVREARVLIADALKVELPHPDDPTLYGSMATIPLPGRAQDAPDIWNALIENHKIEVPVISWDERLWVRISGYAYNQPEEYQRLAEALCSICID
jgi:isopenicillin-N epimerase